jgi:hypothetical protein
MRIAECVVLLCSIARVMLKSISMIFRGSRDVCENCAYASEDRSSIYTFLGKTDLRFREDGSL